MNKFILIKTSIYLILFYGMILSSAAATKNIDYPNVQAALDDLKQQAIKNPSETKVENMPDGWQVVYQKSMEKMIIWSFTPKTENAYPAVVKRQIIEEENKVMIDMSILCQADKKACDELAQTFEKMNHAIFQNSNQSTNINLVFPNQIEQEKQEKKVIELTQKYWYLIDRKKFNQAYNLLSNAIKSTISFENWKLSIEEQNQKISNTTGRFTHKVTWYANPTGLETGLYAAVDYLETYKSAQVCGFIVWKLDKNHQYTLNRIETNYIDNNTLNQLSPTELLNLKTRIGCRL